MLHTRTQHTRQQQTNYWGKRTRGNFWNGKYYNRPNTIKMVARTRICTLERSRPGVYWKAYIWWLLHGQSNDRKKRNEQREKQVWKQKQNCGWRPRSNVWYVWCAVSFNLSQKSIPSRSGRKDFPRFSGIKGQATAMNKISLQGCAVNRCINDAFRFQNMYP